MTLGSFIGDSGFGPSRAADAQTTQKKTAQAPGRIGLFVLLMHETITANMNTTKIISLCATLLLISSLGLKADDSHKQKRCSPEFERMKTLVGTWKGKTDMGQGPVEMTVQYRLIAAGTVLEERDFPGTPHEMVTMYYDQDGTLAMTHYCVMGNRPGMRLNSSDAKSLSFDLDPQCGIDPAKESHMHSLTIRFDDADTITATCKAMIDGKATEHHPVTLKRVNS